MLLIAAKDVPDMLNSQFRIHSYEAPTPPLQSEDIHFNNKNNLIAKCDLCIFTINELKPHDEITDEMVRHFKRTHKAKIMNYQYVQTFKSVTTTKNIKVLFQCDVCCERINTPAELKGHFTVCHAKTICSAMILRVSDQIGADEVGIAIGSFHCKDCSTFLISKKQFIDHSEKCSSKNGIDVKMWYEIGEKFPVIKKQLKTENTIFIRSK